MVFHFCQILLCSTLHFSHGPRCDVFYLTLQSEDQCQRAHSKCFFFRLCPACIKQMQLFTSKRLKSQRFVHEYNHYCSLFGVLSPEHDWSRPWPRLIWLTELFGMAVSFGVRNWTHFVEPNSQNISRLQRQPPAILSSTPQLARPPIWPQGTCHGWLLAD